MRDDDPAIARIRDVLERTAEHLAVVGAHNEALAAFVPSRRVLLFRKDPALVPLGRVWRLGVFLLDAEATLYATGTTTRAVEPGHPTHVSQSAEVRRMYRAAAFRGPFERGETVNFDAPAIALELDSLRATAGPLFLRDTAALVRWSPSAGDDTAVPFETYLDEHIELLLHPPEGA